MKSSKLFFILVATFVLATATFAQQNDDCRRRAQNGQCIGMSTVFVGAPDLRKAKIIVLNAPDLTETQVRLVISELTPHFVSVYGKNFIVVTDERKINPSWGGERIPLTYNVRVRSDVSEMQSSTLSTAGKRAAARIGQGVFSILVQGIPGNNPIVNRTKNEVERAGQDVLQEQIDNHEAGMAPKYRTYAVTSELLRGDGAKFKPLKDPTDYFVIKEVYKTKGRTEHFLVAQGDREDHIKPLEKQIYLGYTSEAPQNGLTRLEFLRLLRRDDDPAHKSQPLDQFLRGDSPSSDSFDASGNCKRREWSDEKNDWVCKDSVETKTPPPCKTQVRDSSGEWRCAAEQQQAVPTVNLPQTQTVAPQPKKACLNTEALRWSTAEKTWVCLPVTNPVIATAPPKAEQPAQVAPASQPPPPTTTAPAVVVSGFAEIYYDPARPKMQGENVKRILAYMVNKNYLGWDSAWDFAWGSNADRAWREVEAAASQAGIPGIIKDGRVNITEWQWLSAIFAESPSTYALGSEMRQTEARIKARQKK